MSDVEITIKVPEELLKRVQKAGLHLEDLPTLIDEQLKQREQQKKPVLQSYTDLADRIAALPDNIKPTPDEIDEAIREVREEMAAERRALKPK